MKQRNIVHIALAVDGKQLQPGGDHSRSLAKVSYRMKWLTNFFRGPKSAEPELKAIGCHRQITSHALFLTR
jgi:hypothetical protein